MPFQSEKQRKYLWANEPAIAREWADKYGSRVKKQRGGVMEYLQNMNLGDIGLYGGAGLGALGVGAGWQSMQDINAINQMAKLGKYGPGNPMPQAFMDKLKGAYTPSNVFKKTGYPTGLKNWFFSRSSPGHFGPVEKAVQVGKHLGSLGGQAVSGLPLAYIYGASKLQETLPMSLIGQGGLSDQNPYFGAMGVSVDPTVEETLRYGDEGKPSPDTGEGSTLAKAWDAIKNEFGGSAEAAEMPNQTIDTSMYGADLDLPGDARYPGVIYSDKLGINLMEGESPENIRKMDEIPHKQLGPTFVRQMIGPDGITYYDFDKDEEEIDPRRIPDRIRGVPVSIPRKMGMLERLRNRFYKPATSAAGGYGIAQLNRMNALGGQYSEPAREQRRQRSRVSNMLARQAAGKSYSQKNLNQLTMGSRPGHYDPPGGGGAAADTSPSTPGNNPFGYR